jgi:hypothetical protein
MSAPLSLCDSAAIEWGFTMGKLEPRLEPGIQALIPELATRSSTLTDLAISFQSQTGTGSK